ncbi:helix-turn-helix transcriptional regulator [Bacteroides finegoldii]|uniref:helix-turn-helix transcriptional regulator n=1 Tax=Bacteroides finegoldii TaxID=338188 RepID=UPI0026735ADA|nr:helix-turn-helix domain-containing protein [Bacteroides finegoldii]
MLYNNMLHDDALVVQLTVSQIKAIIRDVLQESPSYLTSEKSETLTIEEVSELTGYKKATLYKLTHERKIPFHKPAHGGRRIFFKRAEINQWLESNLFETNEKSLTQKEKICKTNKLTNYGKAK